LNWIFLVLGLVLVLLSFEKLTNTNTIPAFSMVFQYNTIRIVNLCIKASETPINSQPSCKEGLQMAAKIHNKEFGHWETSLSQANRQAET
jgi:hypothetical protein